MPRSNKPTEIAALELQIQLERIRGEENERLERIRGEQERIRGEENERLERIRGEQEKIRSEENERQRAHELELARLRNSSRQEVSSSCDFLPNYKEGDDIEDFLLTFERLAVANELPENRWGVQLARRLEGKADTTVQWMYDAVLFLHFQTFFYEYIPDKIHQFYQAGPSFIMSSQDRELFLRAVKEGSVENFTALVLGRKAGNTKKRFNLKEVVSSLSSGAIEDIWNSLQELCTTHLLTALYDEDSQTSQSILKTEKEIAESREILLSIVEVGKETIMCKSSPAGLMQVVIVLNGVLLNFPDDAIKLKNGIAQICIQWMDSKMDGHEMLGGQTILYFMQKSLKEKGSKNDVIQVSTLRENLPSLIIQGNESQKVLEELLVSCTLHENYLAHPMGIHFIAYLLTLSESLCEKLHNAIKNHLVNCTRRQAGIYGLIYLKGWQSTETSMKQVIEKECIQDLMHHAVHADKTLRKSVAPNLLALLGSLHKENKNPKVSKMLFELYEPILWRSLKVANGYVRCNAASLFFDSFPLENPEMNNEESDASLQKQLQLVENLLDDECAVVRSISVYGTFSLLYRHWEMLPATSIKTFVKKVSDLAFDGSSIDSRFAVFKGFAKLLEHPLSHPLLRVLLPNLQSGFHDPSEKVRVAFCDMLLMVKNLKSIKFWSIVPPEHLLARLAIDSPGISRRIVSLIFNSYFPISKPDSMKLERTISLIETNKLASRRFFQIMPKQTDLETIVNFMLLVCKALKVYVRQRSAENSENSVLETTQDKENINSSSDRLNLPEYNDSSFPFNNPEIVSGLLDAITILWKEIYSMIYQRQNSNLLRALHRAYSNAVPLYFMYFKDSIVNESLIYLSSLLPVKAVPMLSGHCMSKLKNMTEEQSCGQPQNYCTLLESMCNWGKADLVLDTVTEWIQEGLKEDQQSTACQPKNVTKKKKKGVLFSNPVSSQPLLGIEFLTFMLCHPICRKVIIENHSDALLEISQQLKNVLPIIEKSVTGIPCSIPTATIDESFLLYVKVQLLMNAKNFDESLEELIGFWQKVIRPILDRPKDNTPVGFTIRRQLAIKISNIVLSITCNAVMIDACSESLFPSIADFALQLLQSDVADVFLTEISSLMQEMSEHSVKTSQDVGKAAKFIPKLLDKLIGVYAQSVKNAASAQQESEKIVTNIVQTLNVFRKDPATKQLYKEMLASLMTAEVAEITSLIDKNQYGGTFDKFEDYPALSAWIMSVFVNRKNILKDFILELVGCVQSGVLKSSAGVLAVTSITHTTFTQCSEKIGIDTLKDLFFSIKTMLSNHQNSENDDSNHIETCTEIISSLQLKYFPEAIS